MSVNPPFAEPPTALDGFAHIARKWDSVHSRWVAKVSPGEFYVTMHDEAIITVLGSCVSACVHDPVRRIGGMNHFMLPGIDASRDVAWGGADALETRYGVAAMENLVNELLKLGASKRHLELKLFGGGRVLDFAIHQIGNRNVDFVREFAAVEGLNVVAEDLGGSCPRKIMYFPATGRVLLKRLRPTQSETIIDREAAYRRSLDATEQTGEVCLFD